MNAPVCSIVIPTYNHAKYIERSIHSALDQTHPSVEVIVVDDGSSDDTADRVGKYLDRIIYHRKENGGLGAARNTGIDLSRGRYLQFLDADDTIDPQKLELQAAVLDNDQKIAVVYSDCRCVDEAGREVEDASYPLAAAEDPLPILLRRSLSGVHAHLARRQAIVEAGMFDTSRFAQEDWELWLKMAIRGNGFKYIPGNLAYYDRVGSRITTHTALMYKRTRHMLEKYLADPDFLKLDDSLKDSFVSYQNFLLATRSYNNGWWKRSRGHFLKAIKADPKLVEPKYWACIPKTALHQVADFIIGKNPNEPEDL